MDTWQLLISILGVILAFLVGFFAEPIKLFFTAKHELKQLRIALYKEVASLHSSLVHIGNKKAKNIPYGWRKYKEILSTGSTGFEVYSYAMSKPVLFYQLREATAFTSVYDNCKIYMTGVVHSNLEDFLNEGHGLAGLIERMILDGELDKRLILSSCDKQGKANLIERLERTVEARRDSAMHNT